MKNFAVAVALACTAIVAVLASTLTGAPSPLAASEAAERIRPTAALVPAFAETHEPRAEAPATEAVLLEGAARAVPVPASSSNAVDRRGASAIDGASSAGASSGDFGLRSSRSSSAAGLSSGSILEGRVERRDGTPAGDAVVHCVPRDSLARMVTTIADERGVFRVELDTRDVAWEISAQSGRARASVTLAAGDRTTDVTLRLESGRNFSGVVVQSGDELPIGDAYVSIERRSGTQLSQLRRWRRVDAAGAFSFEGVEPGRYVLFARAEGFARTRQEVVIAGAQSSERRVAMVSARAQRGTVVDLDGRPIAGARIDVRHAGSRYELADVTDHEGRFAVGELGIYGVDLRVHADGFATVTISDHAAEEASLEIELAPAAELAGTVIDAESGQPIAGATVAVTPGSDAPLGSLGGQTRSGVDGRFRLHGLSRGRWMLLVSAPGFAGARVEVQIGADPSDRVVSLRAGQALTGTVSGPNGAPVVAARVQVASHAMGGGAAEVFVTETDGQGAFTFDGLAAHDYQLVVTASDFARKIETAVVGEHAVVTLERGGSIRGRVIHAEGSVSGSVSARSLAGGPSVTLRVSASGEFAMSGLAAGEYQLRFEGSAGTVEAAVTVRADEEVFRALTVAPASA